MNLAQKNKFVDAYKTKTLVRFYNPYDKGSTDCYILDIGPKFFLLGYIDEFCRFNGFQCLLLADVKRPKIPCPYETFIVNALWKRKQRIKRKPNIKLDDISVLLKSAQKLFPLIVIHRERIKPDSCKIGKVLNVNETHCSLLEIGPDALWDKKPTKILLRDITRVDFGGGYEEALYLVGGDPQYKVVPISTKKSRRMHRMYLMDAS